VNWNPKLVLVPPNLSLLQLLPHYTPHLLALLNKPPNMPNWKFFSYRSLLGELLYAYVTARPDIGYAITTLSKFATAPAKMHYQRLKGLALYLCSTINWGIIY
jgi:hypothetical protein